jgi:hypothetical protein
MQCERRAALIARTRVRIVRSRLWPRARRGRSLSPRRAPAREPAPGAASREIWIDQLFSVPVFFLTESVISNVEVPAEIFPSKTPKGLFLCDAGMLENLLAPNAIEEVEHIGKYETHHSTVVGLDFLVL